MRSAKTLTLFLMALLTSLNVAGQQITGSIRGTVLDPSGVVVQAATVTARQTETGSTRTVATDHQGEYVLVELPIEHYQLEVQAKGFQKYLQQGISLDVNETATVAIHLKLGLQTQQVEVSSPGPGICGLGLLRFQEHSADRIQTASIPR
jgi:carboxypeptidase family protein